MAVTYSIQALQAQSGVSARTLRHWVREKVLPKPFGRGRGARYDDRHVLRARVIHRLRATRLSLPAIRARIDKLSEPELLALVAPEPSATTTIAVPAPVPAQQSPAEAAPSPPPAPTYPSSAWEVVELMDGLLLMVAGSKGPALRRIADDIYRYYGSPKAPRA
jgi:DNA-binding transcriptional MerR regulator